MLAILTFVNKDCTSSFWLQYITFIYFCCF